MRFLAVFLWSCFLATPVLADDVVTTGKDLTTEVWQGKALTATFRVGICYNARGKANGVLLLKHRNGQVDTYHLNGTLKNNEFYLTHSSGHRLSGSLTGPDSMQGRAKLANGLGLGLKGERIRNVPLAAADCAPLPGRDYR